MPFTVLQCVNKDIIIIKVSVRMKMYFHRRQTCTKRLSKPKFVTCKLKSELLSAIHYPN